MIKIVIFYQSKPISLYLKNKSKICKLHVFIHKIGNKTSIHPNSNSTSFMFNKKNCERKGKKVIH